MSAARDRSTPNGKRQLVDDRTRVILCDSTHPDRRALESFVAQIYGTEHGAELSYFLPTLMGVLAADGTPLGAIGVREAEPAEHLFLETYLDEPVEAALSRAARRVVPRSALAEIGNLASASPGGGRILVTAFAHYLDALGLSWAVFTATRPLRNSFEKLGVELIDIARADPGRLPDAGRSWGTYYAMEPRVTGVRIREVCLLSRTNRRFAGSMGPVRRAAARVGHARRAARWAS